LIRSARSSLDLSQLVGPLTGSVSQLGQELRAIISGDINQDTQTAKALGITREQILAAREQNRLADFLNEKLKVAAVTGKLVGQTFAAATSNLREAGTILATQVTGGLLRAFGSRLTASRRVSSRSPVRGSRSSRP
jgi:hypothetical protein